MTFTFTIARLRRLATVAVTVGWIPLTSCNKDKILVVTDPDLINPTDVRSAAAAEALRVGALARLNNATSGFTGGSQGEGAFFFGGVVADELRSGDTFVQRDQADQRAIETTNSSMTETARQVNRLRTAAVQAIGPLTEFVPNQLSSVGQMYWVKGYAENMLAENFCNGTPVSVLDENNAIIYGMPETNKEMYTRAIASFDSAFMFAPAGQARSDTVKNLAAIGKGRALMNLGQFAAAAAAVVAVPDNFRFSSFHSAATTDNQIWALNNSAGRYQLGDQDGGVGLNFATAGDPRVPACIGGSAACQAFDPTQTRTRSFDNVGFGPGLIGGPFYVQLVFPTRDADVAISTGTEARLLEAEAALRGGDVAGWLAKLNYLRANFNTFKQPSDPCNASGTQITGCPVIPAGGTLLPALADPGTQTAREDLLFRERAFWLFMTGHRLADMRRLVRPTSQGGYGRPENTVYPNGPYIKGGIFGTDKMLIIPQAEENNPNFHGCLDRDP
jgi:hypothetical protein